MKTSNQGLKYVIPILLGWTSRVASPRVWESEAPAGAARPNFARIVKEACSNVRASLMQLQTELLLAD